MERTHQSICLTVVLFALLTALAPRLVWLQRLGDWDAPLQRSPMEEVDIARHLVAGRGYWGFALSACAAHGIGGRA